MFKTSRILTAGLLFAAVACSKSPEPSAKGETKPADKAATAATGDKGAPPAPTKPAGPKAEGEGYVAEVSAPADCKVAAPCKAHLVLHPTTGFHVNKDFPVGLDVTPPTGVDLSKPKQSTEDAAKLDETEADFDIELTAKDPGDKAFAAVFKFAVCTPTTCNPHKEKLAWNVNVQ